MENNSNLIFKWIMKSEWKALIKGRMESDDFIFRSEIEQNVRGIITKYYCYSEPMSRTDRIVRYTNDHGDAKDNGKNSPMFVKLHLSEGIPRIQTTNLSGYINHRYSFTK